MNDQPKPATGYTPISDDPMRDCKPATGEVEKLADWILNRLPATGGEVDFTRLELETRINAALAAERDRFAFEHTHAAALEQQLAAERGKLADAEILCADLQRNRDEIHQQLAAAVEALAWLDEFVVEPEYFPGEGDRQWWQEKRAALAKIGREMIFRLVRAYKWCR